ncbi:glycosyltransferase [Thomasclavelia sp.]
MVETKVLVKNGEFISSKNIIEDGDFWEFTNNDPQIHIRFNESIKGIRLNFKDINAVEDFFNAIVYYRNFNEIFREENTVHFKLNTMEQSIHEIHFFNKVDEIRFDMHDLNAKMKIGTIMIEPLTNKDTILSCLKKNINKNDTEDKIVLLSHDLTSTGAPILAYNIAKKMKDLGKEVVILAGHHNVSFLTKKYTEAKIPIIYLDNNSYNYANVYECLNYNGTKYLAGKEYIQALLEMLRNNGYSKVITNTIVSGEYVRVLKDYDFKIVSLIHEMKTTIELYNFYNYGREIARYSDYIVFPDEIVVDDFKELFSEITGECLIRPQGVYLKKDKIKENDFSEYGFTINDYIIMNSGTCELRKGIDLFISAASILKDICQKEIHFVWTGNFGNNRELEGWMHNQIERAGLTKYIHIIPFIENQNKYKNLLSNINIFWSTSREDPFPSVVLEALNYNIPVVGFKDAGGINTMLTDSRGYLIENFNVFKMAEISKNIIENELSNNNDDEKKAEFLKYLEFSKYINFLVELTTQPKLIKPDYDFYKWKKCETKHYYELQLPNKNYIKKSIELDKAIKKKKRKHLSLNREVVLLDTGIGSDNIGDEIIMSYCQNICEDVFNKENFLHIPTHIYDKKSEYIEDKLKILCGTNLIYKRMEDSRQFAFPNDIKAMNNMCLLGVGMQSIGLEFEMSEYSKKLLKYMLNPKIIHSVRDNETKKVLEQIGIKNVLNTSCPTMWALTPEHCKKILTKKSDIVVTTVTDYMKDADKDAKMLEILKNNYTEVYIWIQGQYDYEYLESIADLREFKIIPSSLEELDRILKKDNVEYIGTRLHAGIRSLNYFNRSLVISIDNRARAISKDTNLPIIERNNIENNLEQWINSEHETNIILPIEAINSWKNQFKNTFL